MLPFAVYVTQTSSKTFQGSPPCCCIQVVRVLIQCTIYYNNQLLAILQSLIVSI